jgi:hypothetical protein
MKIIRALTLAIAVLMPVAAVAGPKTAMPCCDYCPPGCPICPSHLHA